MLKTHKNVLALFLPRNVKNTNVWNDLESCFRSKFSIMYSSMQEAQVFIFFSTDPSQSKFCKLSWTKSFLDEGSYI